MFLFQHLHLSQRFVRWLQRSLCVVFGIVLACTAGLAHHLGVPLDAESISIAMPSVNAHPTTQLASHSAAQFIEQGRQHYKDQRFHDAVTVWNRAVDQLATQSLQQALALSYLTAAYQQLSQWESGDRAITQSLNLLSPLPNSVLKQQVSAQVYNTLGSLQFTQGQTRSALATWKTAADFYAQTHDDSRYLNCLLNQVQAQQSLGYYLQVRKTLEIVEQHLPAQSPPLQVMGYQRLGQTYRLLGNLETSQLHLQTALDLAQQTNMETGAILLELANTTQAQSESSGATGEVRERAIALYQQAEQSTDAAIRLKARLNHLKLLVQTDPGAAWSVASTLATQIDSIPSGRSQIYAYINAAQSLMHLQSPDAVEMAAHFLNQAIQTSIALQDIRAETYALGYLGHAYEIAQQWDEAKALTEQALVLAQTIDAADITYQWQWQLGRLLKQQKQKEAAIQAYRAAYATLQSLKQDLVTVGKDLQFSFQDSVEPVYRELVNLLLQSNINGQRHSTHQTVPQSQLVEARAVIESLQVAELNNFFRTACLDAQQVNLDEVNQTDAAIIYPIILPDRLAIIASLPGRPLQQYISPVPKADLEQALLDWRLYLEKSFTAPEGKALGQQLYHWIIDPMHQDLTETDSQTLVFVLDGALRNAPMAALYDGDRYLMESYAIALSPGLQLLGPRPLQDTQVSALLGGLTESRHGFGALSHVDEELNIVESLLDSQILLNQQFTTTALARHVTRTERPIVHLATHGQFSSTLEDTFILAWDRPILVDDLSRLLRTGDQNRHNPIELLVLSACETATGDNRAALGLAGLSLQAGARSTLASLWTLDDASGAYFAQNFYQALAKPHTTKAEALRQAQQSLLVNPNYRHPKYWSAYVLVGNWL